jgi:hypothetical protein
MAVFNKYLCRHVQDSKVQRLAEWELCSSGVAQSIISAWERMGHDIQTAQGTWRVVVFRKNDFALI